MFVEDCVSGVPPMVFALLVSFLDKEPAQVILMLFLMDGFMRREQELGIVLFARNNISFSHILIGVQYGKI